MKRVSCADSFKRRVGWVKEVFDSEYKHSIMKITECFISSGPRVMKFEDIKMSYDGIVYGYSCNVR